MDTESNTAYGYRGPVGAFFNNFPEQGMEMNAFYDNTGYDQWGRRPEAPSGDTNDKFKLPQGSYRMAGGEIDNHNYRILLTAGGNGKWYIYPDSMMVVN